MNAPSDALVFLDTIFTPALEQSGGWLLVWQAQGKRSAWFRSAEEAAAYALASSAADTYVGVGISPEDYGPSLRAKAEQIIAVPALWLDVDVAHPVHGKPHLPPTLDAAWALITEVGKAPSCVVHTGHGLQAWWRIADGACPTDAERERIADAVRRWQRQQIAQAKVRHGWALDATHDLARLMRLPGTWNLKSDPVPVTLECIGGGARRN